MELVDRTKKNKAIKINNLFIKIHWTYKHYTIIQSIVIIMRK